MKLTDPLHPDYCVKNGAVCADLSACAGRGCRAPSVLRDEADKLARARRLVANADRAKQGKGAKALDVRVEAPAPAVTGHGDTLRCIEVMDDVAVYVSHDVAHGITALSLARADAFVGAELTDLQRVALIAALSPPPVPESERCSPSGPSAVSESNPKAVTE